jgi:hypothetical protein
MTNDKMTDGQQIRERMWDYVYGLLSEEESQEMVARIKSDPQVARLYAEVRLKGELVAQAAVVEDSSLHLTADPKDHPAVTRKLTTTGPRKSAVWHQRATQIIALAVSGLIVVLGTGLCWPRSNEQMVARHFVVTDLVAPVSLTGGLTNELLVNTYHVNPAGEAGENASADVHVRLVDTFGKEQFQKSLRTDANGQAKIEIPGTALEPGARFEVNPRSARGNAQTLALKTELPVEPEPQIAYFLREEPIAESPPDAPVWAWNFNAFSARPAAADEALIAGLGRERRDAEPARGGAVVNGYLQQTNRTAGRALFAPMLAKDQTREERASAQAAQVVEAGKPVQVDIPAELADRSLDFAVNCRGVTVSATSDAENAAADAKSGAMKNKIGPRQVTVQVPPEADGLMEVEVFDQSSIQAEPLQRKLIYRQPLRKLVVELPDFRNQVAPGEDVELKLHVVDEKGEAATNTRVGIRVWNERLVQQLGDRPLLLTDAVLKGQGLQYGQNALGAGNQVVPQNDLGRVRQQANRYQRAMRSPSGTAAMNAPAGGLPASGTTAQDRQLNEAQEFSRPATVAPTKITLASNREAVKIAIRSAADEAAARRERAIHALGVLAVLGGFAVLIIVAALAAMKLATNVRMLVVPLVTAMASLVIGIAWLGARPDRSRPEIAMAESAVAQSAPATDLAAAPVRRPQSMEFRPESPSQNASGPATLSAAASPPASALADSIASQLGDAAKPTEPESLRGAAPGGAAGVGAPSLATARARTIGADDRAKAAATEKKEPANERTATTTPPSLYFEPNLTTDDKGNATVHFKMPSIPCEYRLLIDALGNGRIGSRQELLTCPASGK